MKHSVVIPTVGRVEALIRCVDSIARQALAPCEVIIVACHNQEAVKQQVCSRHPSLPIVFLSSEICNSPHQKNLGATRATGDIVDFLDDDVVLSDDYLRRIDETFTHYPEAVGVGGRIMEAEANRDWNFVLKLLRRCFLLNHNNGNGDFMASSFPAMQFERDLSGETRTRLLVGCASYRSGLFKTFRYDEELGKTLLWEDVDFAAMVSRKHVLYYQPLAILTHCHAPGGRPHVGLYAYRYLYNHHYLAHKHGRKGLMSFLGFWWGHLGALLAMVVKASGSGEKVLSIFPYILRAEIDWVRRRQRHERRVAATNS